MKKWSIGLLALTLLACGDKKDRKTTHEEKNHFVVEGNIENGRGSVILLAQIRNGNQTEIVATDTADKEGNFHLQGFSREKFIAIFNFDMNKKIFLIVDTADRIKLKIPQQNYDNYEVSGSPESQVFRNLRNIEVESGKALTAIREQVQNIDPSDEKRMEAKRKEFETVYDKYVKIYADSLRHVESPLVQLYYYNFLNVPFDEQMKTKLYDNAVKSGLQGELVQGYVRQYRAELTTAIGQMAPELNFADTSGKPVALSSLRGKVVLIDFWASWCGPCRQENPNVLRLYNQYKDRGFEVYGVSLDEDRGQWLEAIHKDGIYWTHVSDLMKWQSAAARLYAVSSIPATFLLDREGKIIGKNLRGNELEAKLRMVLR